MRSGIGKSKNISKWELMLRRNRSKLEYNIAHCGDNKDFKVHWDPCWDADGTWRASIFPLAGSSFYLHNNLLYVLPVARRAPGQDWETTMSSSPSACWDNIFPKNWEGGVSSNWSKWLCAWKGRKEQSFNPLNLCVPRIFSPGPISRVFVLWLPLSLSFLLWHEL